ncbi:ISC system 2Fe-2S type ferredoxin [Buchnera aphidicola]|uniref:2Fe-2S ferredoxin n=1 Tax=Buchnera aphidicola (Sarucallis kahawaluokalani) TaxID=1241878 RepID=A0A4D6Y8C8_9GAMM|nr:ISC system 2Fe-2S type ferredoxin [Buchnera aphidicola]QCI26186.1 ISC system 2Fe-2S type ferredoxin [Buchnera aphidicola (Sarucallis kahawaluokalani)]
MSKIIFLPNKNLIPKKKSFIMTIGKTILDIALKNNIHMQHACEKSCACSTCHCIIRKGYDALSEITEKEDDVLDKAYGVEYYSRLACQAKIINLNTDIEVEIPDVK